MKFGKIIAAGLLLGMLGITYNLAAAETTPTQIEGMAKSGKPDITDGYAKPITSKGDPIDIHIEDCGIYADKELYQHFLNSGVWNPTDTIARMATEGKLKKYATICMIYLKGVKDGRNSKALFSPKLMYYYYLITRDF